MPNIEDTLKKDNLIRKYSNKPIPKFLKFLGKIRTLDEYEDWIKETNKSLVNWIIDYLIILPFLILISQIPTFIFFCLTALRLVKTPPMFLTPLFLAEGISISWYLLLNLIKDIKGAIKNG